MDLGRGGTHLVRDAGAEVELLGAALMPHLVPAGGIWAQTAALMPRLVPTGGIWVRTDREQGFGRGKENFAMFREWQLQMWQPWRL
jgi:hypothetical protein